MNTLEQFYKQDGLVNASIRVHKATQQASAIDTIMMVTGQKSAAACQTLSRLRPEFTTKKCDKLRINGKGRETWVADAPTSVLALFYRYVCALGRPRTS